LGGVAAIKERTIPAEMFIGRFLQHVAPRGLPRMRHYGFLSNPRKAKCLVQCRALLGETGPQIEELPTNRTALLLALTGVDKTRCPRCGQPGLTVIEQLPRQRGLFSPLPPARSMMPRLGDDSS
jgi:Putative transposase